MATGYVLWFSATKGYGLIRPDTGGNDVFVHVTAVERSGLTILRNGQQVFYEIESKNGKSSAVNLALAETK